MGRFLDPLDIRDTGETVGGRPVYEFLADFRYEYGNRWSGDVVTCREGDTTDFSSTPRVIWWLIPPTLGRWAAAIHDTLYRSGEMPRNVADAIFRAALRDVPRQGGWMRRATSAFLLGVAHWTPYGSGMRVRLFRWSGSVVDATGVDPVRRWLMWAGVRIFGRPAWKKYRERDRR